MSVEQATGAGRSALAEQFGAGRIEGRTRAHFVAVEAPDSVAGG
jgi:hypothetical protein